MNSVFVMSDSNKIYPLNTTTGNVLENRIEKTYTLGSENIFCTERGLFPMNSPGLQIKIPDNVVEAIIYDIDFNQAFWILNGSTIALYSKDGLTKIREIEIGENFVRGYFSLFRTFFAFSQNYVYTFNFSEDSSGQIIDFSLTNTYKSPIPIKKNLFLGHPYNAEDFRKLAPLIFEDGSVRFLNVDDHTMTMIYNGAENKAIDGIFIGSDYTDQVGAIILTEKTLEFINTANPSENSSIPLPKKNPVALGANILTTNPYAPK